MFKSFGNKIKNIFNQKLDEEFFENMEDLLIEADLGGVLSMEISEKLRAECKRSRVKNIDDLNLITLHLGNGCSISAIENGKCMDTGKKMI